ncbi:putative transporter [Photobacterium aphoticum]|uniref:Putative transporter n=1 Tax=Photobacterium aphoticum TaxID=754436 RepID=A0A090QZY4_9GAMM|nr:putative transporter [Photobacterium aphoticum]
MWRPYKGDIGIKALVLCIPIAANTGGIATPIGTPPNAIALQYLTGDNAISFLGWMMLGLPFVIFQLAFAWWLLQKLFPSSQSHMTLKLEASSRKAGRPLWCM